eukprot:c10709_g1_i1.p1 GENE.c10709_g1_i1~~c10709_g1_i1.p1  ORF type:complete len:129 (-),score=12.33 c10709_g1_i1:1088-1474(-)
MCMCHFFGCFYLLFDVMACKILFCGPSFSFLHVWCSLFRFSFAYWVCCFERRQEVTTHILLCVAKGPQSSHITVLDFCLCVVFALSLIVFFVVERYSLFVCVRFGIGVGLCMCVVCVVWCVCDTVRGY